ncbi:hypothetical protein [Streptomyces kaempferi]|uniref:Uncharacterized protein n=1 Tax=Streptomyces kaempferi TaxID=333725 RepID=A0ABW3XRG3_9ACTN
MLGNVNAGALRNWVLNLHNELSESGIYTAHIAINTRLGEGRPRGHPLGRPRARRAPVVNLTRL